MKLRDAFYCPECQEVFNYAEYHTVCPSCANRYAFSLQRVWFSQPKEVQNEDVKISRVYVTPARYDVCHAGTTKDDYSHYYSKPQCNTGKVANVGRQFKRNCSFYRLGITTVRNITKFLNCINVHRKYWKSKSSVKSKLQRIDANTLAGILYRR